MRKRPDRFEEVEVKCFVCGKKFMRPKFKEEHRKFYKHRPTCSPKCSGKLGGIIRSAKV